MKKWILEVEKFYSRILIEDTDGRGWRVEDYYLKKMGIQMVEQMINGVDG